MKKQTMKLPIILIAIGMVVAVAASFLVGIRKEPVIREHDFPYAITYRLNGEEQTLEGVFKGRFDRHDGTSRYYVGEYLQNGNVQEAHSFTIAQEDGVELYIVAVLDAAYLMGDPDEYDTSNEDPYLEAMDSEGMYVDVSERFGAEIIRWEYPKPVENSFVFAGFSLLHAGSMLIMLLVGILTILACVIFVKKGENVSYQNIDKVSVVVDFLVGFAAIPFISLVVFLLPLTMNEESVMYQIYLCIPALTAFAIAASVALRRKGFAKSGLVAPFVWPVLFFAEILVESFIYNVFS